MLGGITVLFIAICDNNPAVIVELTRMLKSGFLKEELRIVGCETKGELLEAMAGGQSPDIVFMDILFGEEDGIQVSKELFPRGSRTQVIFVTAYAANSAEVCDTNHVMLLQKPIRQETLVRAVSKALGRLSQLQEGDTHIFFKKRSHVERIPIRSIRYLESLGRKVVVHCTEQSYEHYTSLATVMKSLPPCFVQCHKSFCVNMEVIQQVKPTELLLDDGTIIRISHARKKETMEALSRFWTIKLYH